ncbi:hypothetical protein Tco_1124453 [Tanacetum coccineum]|uniref:Uncharacterized protein n=1 Tax=Tanacetum coccineum TaxID=301880 RepID=A0ABQ5J8Z8_9ASTR
MDDPNINMEEYISLEEEKARKRGKMYNWETATYGKIWDNEDIHDLGSVETEFPAIVFNDTLTSEATLSCEPTVSSLNNDEIDFRISFDESGDEDCTVIFDKNSFSYKIISVNDLKMDSENDNDKVNMPLLPSPEPTVSCFDNLDFFKDFENEFPAIIYNDTQTSKLDFLTEHTLSPQHIDEFDLKSEKSLSEYDEEEENVLYFNDLFRFNVIYLDDSKSNKDNDDDKIDIEHSSGDLSVKPLPDVINTDVGAYAQSLSSQIVYMAYPNPMDTAYRLSGHYPVFIFSTVDTAYSLNEYSVFDTSINTAYPGVWIRRIDFLYSFSVKAHVILLPSQLSVKLKNEEITEGIIRNYYDGEDGETPRFELWILNATIHDLVDFQDSSEEVNEIQSKEDLDNLFGPLYEEYYATRTLEVLDNSAVNTLDNKDTPSSSSIIVEDHDAPQIVSSSK